MGIPPKRGRRRARLLCVTVLAAAALAAGPHPGTAQEVGLFGTAATSDLSEIADTRGGGAYLRVFPARHLSLRAAVYHQSDSAHRRDLVCVQYLPIFGCDEESIHTDTRLRGFTLAAQLRARPLDVLELDLGPGLSLNQLQADEQTESGRRSALFVRTTMQFGWLVTGSARARPFASLPLTLEVGVTGHRLRLRGCAEPEEFQYEPYTPYCGDTDQRELRVGVGYNPGW